MKPAAMACHFATGSHLAVSDRERALTVSLHTTSISSVHSQPMDLITTDALRNGMSGQALLAALSLCEEVRRMHEDLEQFYRTQLTAALLAERLNALSATG